MTKKEKNNAITFGSVNILVGRPVELEGISSVVHVLPGEEKQPGVLWRVVETHLMSKQSLLKVVIYHRIKMRADLPSWKVVSNSDRFISLADNLERECVCSVTITRDGAAWIRSELMNDCLLGMDGGSVFVGEVECHLLTMPSIFLCAIPEISNCGSTRLTRLKRSVQKLVRTWERGLSYYQAVIFPIHLLPPSSISSTSKLVIHPSVSLVSLSDHPLFKSMSSASAPRKSNVTKC